MIVETTLAKLEREIAALKAERSQGRLFSSQSYIDDLDRSIETRQEELGRRRPGAWFHRRGVGRYRSSYCLD
jgi:hypothetical protein